ncbi:hypothetical protein D3C78_1169990 [compost metagenome]
MAAPKAGTQRWVLSSVRTACRAMPVCGLPASRCGTSKMKPLSWKVRLQLVLAAPPSILHTVEPTAAGLLALTARLTGVSGALAVRTETVVLVLPTKLMGVPPGDRVRLLVPPV